MATLDLLGDVAAASAVLVVVEDAHWLDRATAEVLAFVARRIEADPIVLLVATRDGYVSAPARRAPGASPRPSRCRGGNSVLAAVAPLLSVRRRETILGEAANNPLALTELPLTADSDAEAPGVVPLTERLGRPFAARVRATCRRRPHELEQLDLDDLEVARARYTSELLDARALADHSRVAV